MKQLKGLLSIVGMFIATLLFSDEGLWPLNMVPKEQIYEKYHASINDVWLQHLQRSCLRISSGGSASFISPQGLLITNHHVGSKAIYDLSTEEENLIRDGFYAKTFEEERKCPNLYVDQLISIRDVTGEINQQLSENMTSSEREKARKKAIVLLKKTAQTETGLQPEIAPLYQGARYHLYLYKRFTDVRLVMAPEESIAFFGGDKENFEYPRYNLDVCFFRVYENDKPLTTDDFLRWNPSGPKEKEVLFVAGHPGKTERELTSSHISFLRDQEFPLLLQLIKEKIERLEHFGRDNEENKRRAAQSLSRLQNALKVFKALSYGLNHSTIIANKQKYESNLFKSLNKEQIKPWLTLEQALEELKTYYNEFFILEGRGSGYSKLYMWAKHLTRVIEERAKPNEKRLKEYTDSELPSLELDLFSTQPIYKDLEEMVFQDSLHRLVNMLGINHPAVKAVLKDKSVKVRAKEMIEGTKLDDPTVRKQLYEDPLALQNSDDPMILIAKILDTYSRPLRERVENEFLSVKNDCYTEIVQVLFDRYGESRYPDANFTLRLSIGAMEGYGKYSPTTTIGGVFDSEKEHQGESPYCLPNSWLQNESFICKETPFNFVSTNDIIGGNSGSPVINAKGEFVGIIFDGNAYSFLWDFEFDESEPGRAISVHSQVIIHALEKIYHAHSLVQEILNP